MKLLGMMKTLKARFYHHTEVHTGQLRVLICNDRYKMREWLYTVGQKSKTFLPVLAPIFSSLNL